jgi:GDP-mannose 6-dehydrogenase
MKVSIFGLGYVGCVTAACLVRDGHEVWGVDVNAEKVERVGRGDSPIIEPGLTELLQAAAASGRLHTVTDAAIAIAATEASLISVGTPVAPGGGHDLTHVDTVCRQIAEAIAAKAAAHVVILRSTVPPGTTRRCAAALQAIAGSTPVHVAFNPEFLREGAALRDYDEPPYTVIGTDDPAAERAVRQLYASVQATVIVTDPEVAETVKDVANIWHATKIAFANEIGRISRAWGIDGRTVMDLIMQDTKLNISPVYLKPGFAYGGSCLPKDLASMLHGARERGVSLPLLEGVQASNLVQIDHAARLILASGVKDLVFMGLAFKPGTDDLRESPAVSLVKRLLGEGCRIRIYDRAVAKARLLGTNLAYIRAHLPHLEDLLVDDPAPALAAAPGVVIVHRSVDFIDRLAATPEGTHLFDLAGLYDTPPAGRIYHGICW